MIVLDVIYVAIATIGVMLALQVITFLVVRVMYPPEPKIVYRNVPVPSMPQSVPPQVVSSQAVPPQIPLQVPPPVFTQDAENTQETKLPEYDIRGPSSTSLRLDAGLPDGLQETRPPGT